MATKKLCTFDFEVFCRVQGVSFIEQTEKRAKQLGVNGWCSKTRYGTIREQIEGPGLGTEEMKCWLRNKGSPKSRIDKALFTDIKDIPAHNFKSFTIKP